jgi:prepilin-type N-terminal cleavage/methylation domain-containing protein
MIIRNLLKSHRRSGVSLVELLIALAITASLLTATAIALNATSMAYKVNEEQSSLIQTTRLTLNRIVSGVRTTKNHSPVDTVLAGQFNAGFVVTDTGMDMMDSNNVHIRYTYDAVTQKLTASVGGVKHTLADGVTAFTITFEPMRSPESIRTGGPFDLLQRATITMSIKTAATNTQSSETTGKLTITLSASVMPRRNTW